MRYALMILVLLTTACATREPAPRPPVDVTGQEAEFLEFFRKAFFEDGEQDRGAAVDLQRFEQRAIVAVEPGRAWVKGRLQSHVDDIAGLLPVDPVVRETTRGDRIPFIFVTVGPVDEMNKLSARGLGLVDVPCIYVNYVRQRGGDELVRARIYLMPGAERYWRDCLPQELAQALGVNGDGRLGAPSAFGDEPPPGGGYSEWDRLALWLAYHPRFRPGMDWEEARPIAASIIAP